MHDSQFSYITNMKKKPLYLPNIDLNPLQKKHGSLMQNQPHTY
jgi:hypothetical protein